MQQWLSAAPVASPAKQICGGRLIFGELSVHGVDREDQMPKMPSKVLAVQSLARLLFCGVVLSQPCLSQSANPQPAPLSGLAPDHATISVENLDRVAGWYQRVLGFKVANRFDNNPDLILEQLSIPGYRIDLAKYKGSVRPAPVDPLYLQQGWIHVVFNVQDVPEAFKVLQALKANVIVGSKDDKGIPTRLILHDPEGNEIEVVTRR
jgi:catechol 2,3-dioxygenase-like lactoylglutathione lyase family enzyme